MNFIKQCNNACPLSILNTHILASKSHFTPHPAYEVLPQGHHSSVVTIRASYLEGLILSLGEGYPSEIEFLVFQVAALHSMVVGYQNFGGLCCLHL